MSRRWWISWDEPVGVDGDARPRGWPLPPGVPRFWRSGELGDGSAAILCAVVDAPDEDAARALIQRAWGRPHADRPRGWRFCEPQPDGWMPPADRFPP